MTKQTNGQQMSKWNKMLDWYSRQAYTVGMIYSLGASVVIIGALFKILHWPGASYVLMVGMFTEAFLFALGIFERPHTTYHWENVFPQLADGDAKKLDNNLYGAPKSGIEGLSAIEESDVTALKDGITKLGKAAGQLSSLGEVAVVSNNLIEKMNAAGSAADLYTSSQSGLLSATEKLVAQYATIETSLNEVSTQMKNYGKNVDSINMQLNAINSLYELQLKDIQEQETLCKEQINTYKSNAEKIISVNTNISNLNTQITEVLQNATTAVTTSKEYVAAQQKLAEQVAALNKVYGNMLNAL